MIKEKLLAFQKMGVTIEKDAINPHFKNRYSSLGEVLSKVIPPLLKLGVVVIQTPTANGLKTQIVDTTDDTYIEGIVPFVGVTDMQKLGGAVTYARRYSLISMLNLEEEDDDGNTASQKKYDKPNNAIIDDFDL